MSDTIPVQVSISVDFPVDGGPVGTVTSLNGVRVRLPPSQALESFPVDYDGRTFQAVRLADPDVVMGIGGLRAALKGEPVERYGPGTWAHQAKMTAGDVVINTGRWGLGRLNDDGDGLVEALVVRKDGVFRSKHPDTPSADVRLGDVPAGLRYALDRAEERRKGVIPIEPHLRPQHPSVRTDTVNDGGKLTFKSTVTGYEPASDRDLSDPNLALIARELLETYIEESTERANLLNHARAQPDPLTALVCALPQEPVPSGDEQARLRRMMTPAQWDEAQQRWSGGSPPPTPEEAAALRKELAKQWHEMKARERLRKWGKEARDRADFVIRSKHVCDACRPYSEGVRIQCLGAWKDVEEPKLPVGDALAALKAATERKEEARKRFIAAVKADPGPSTLVGSAGTCGQCGHACDGDTCPRCRAVRWPFKG